MQNMYIRILSGVIFLSALLFFYACEKDMETKKVTYQITRSVSGFKVFYKDAKGEIISDSVVTNSAEDVWKYSFDALPRQIVYVSGNYKNINSALEIKILIDGKVYKQASTKYDTTMFVTVSGTVPE